MKYHLRIEPKKSLFDINLKELFAYRDLIALFVRRDFVALTTNPEAKGQVFNTAVGERADLNILTKLLKEYLSKYDSKIADTKIKYGPERLGDIPHSLASIEKAETLLGYKPIHTLEKGLKEAVDWYWENLK